MFSGRDVIPDPFTCKAPTLTTRPRRPDTCARVVDAIKQLVIAIDRPTRFIWVQAHSGLEQNELAGLASRQSRVTRCPLLDHSVYDFTYRIKGRLPPR
jgi:hypothetical protein